MTQRKYFLFFATFFFFLILVVYFAINFYFLTRLNSNSSKIKFAGDISDQAFDQDESTIKLKSIYKAKNPKFRQIREQLVRNFAPCSRVFNYSQLWSQFDIVGCVFM